MIYDPVLNLAVCQDEKCGYAIPLDGVRKHFIRSHNTVPSAAREVEESLRREQMEADVGLNRETRRKYSEASNPESVNNPVLAALGTLPVHVCLKSPGCGFIARKDATVRKHMRICDVCEETAEPVEVNAQSIYGGNKCKFFEVYVANDPDRGSCCISSVMKKIEGSKPSNTEDLSVSQMDSYLSMMRFDQHLRLNSLSMEEGFELTKIGNGERDGLIRKLIHAYHKRAFDTCERKVHIKAHRFLESDMSLAVSKETVESYEGRMSRLLAFVVACCIDRKELREHFPKPVVECVKQVALCAGSVNDDKLLMLHKVLSSLFFDPVRDGQEGLMLFLSCCSVFLGKDRKSYRFGSASDNSPMLAALKHLARCIVVWEIYVGEDVDTEEGWEWANRATNGNLDTGVNYLQYCMKLSNRVRSGELHRARFVVCPRHPNCGIIDGHELSLVSLGENMRKLQIRTWSILEDEVLHGLQVTEQFWTACGEMQDAMTDRTTGYWFGTHTANHHILQSWREAFLKKIRPVLLQTDGTLDAQRAKDFLNKCEEVQKHLYVLMQACSGAPARATELGVVQVCNTPSAVRNLFLSGGQIFTAVFYHKCRNMQDGVGKPIVRYPDAVTAGLIMVYLLVVRQVESAVVHLLLEDSGEGSEPGSECTSTGHRDSLFASRGRRVNGDRLRHWFEKGMKSVGIQMNTSQYRQYHGGVVKNFLGLVDEDLEDRRRRDPSYLLHNQAGHSEKTGHSLYGVSTLDMRNLTGTEMDAYRYASKLWHGALGLKHGRPCGLQEDSVETSPVSETGNQSPSSVDAQEVICRLDRLERTISSFINTGGEERGSRKRDSVRANLDSRFSSPEKKVCRKSAISQLNEEMRHFLDSEDAEFRSKEQELAVRLAIEGKKDALVVLPTGGGKSMTFMLSAYMHPEKVLVVICPLVSLQQDIRQRCNAAGLEAMLWDEREVAGVRIVLVSIEHVNREAYQSYIREKHATRELHAIFIDEGHLTLLWRRFRESMESLHTYVRPKNVEVPIITLTATSPPVLSERIARACGMSEWETVRQATFRRNIRYSVREVTEEDMFRHIDSALCACYKEYKSSSFRAIVYVPTRDACEILSVTLRALTPQIPCHYYHAGMEPQERKRAQNEWLGSSDGKAHVMVATSAFGCGIDMPTVRVVIHAGAPNNLTEYIQESGRAGRDGNPATSIVFNTRGAGGKQRPSRDRIPFVPGRDAPLRPCSESNWDEAMFGSVESLKEKSEECRRWVLDRFADGNTHSMSCQDRGMEACDVCFMKKRNGARVIPGVRKIDRMETENRMERMKGLVFRSSATFPEETTEKSPDTKSYSSSASADEMKEYAVRIERTFCPLCTVQKRKVVNHIEANEQRWKCYKGRCLRCGTRGHNTTSCEMFRKEDGANGCHSCSIGVMEGKYIHEREEYGNKTCRYKKILTLALAAWEDTNLRERMIGELSGVEGLLTMEELEGWLLGKEGKELGIKTFMPWFFDTVIT